jgi:hypothetical protein
MPYYPLFYAGVQRGRLPGACYVLAFQAKAKKDRPLVNKLHASNERREQSFACAFAVPRHGHLETQKLGLKKYNQIKTREERSRIFKSASKSKNI